MRLIPTILLSSSSDGDCETNNKKRTLSFWGRDGHQIRLAFPYRKPSKLEYMTHKFKRNETIDEHISNMRNILFKMEVQTEPALSEKEKIDGLINSLPDEFRFIKSLYLSLVTIQKLKFVPQITLHLAREICSNLMSSNLFQWT
ncbi:uncharacterized protein LOC109840768 isoform X3 [Asparagus officinalis]|uniref:uncharacterized protein LOC109840768 isoform X3 n=1 Tax=Asparagus officinalis TaxID=4686 RepID=UPI00098E3DB3|nr:uncharacterized protein LOC109840768 isoform X3 [Asparagus officinalis]